MTTTNPVPHHPTFCQNVRENAKTTKIRQCPNSPVQYVLKHRVNLFRVRCKVMAPLFSPAGLGERQPVPCPRGTPRGCPSLQRTGRGIAARGGAHRQDAIEVLSGVAALLVDVLHPQEDVPQVVLVAAARPRQLPRHHPVEGKGEDVGGLRALPVRAVEAPHQPVVGADQPHVEAGSAQGGPQDAHGAAERGAAHRHGPLGVPQRHAHDGGGCAGDGHTAGDSDRSGTRPPGPPAHARPGPAPPAGPRPPAEQRRWRRRRHERWGPFPRAARLLAAAALRTGRRVRAGRCCPRSPLRPWACRYRRRLRVALWARSGAGLHGGGR